MKLQQISLDLILEPAEQVRKVICAEVLEELAESIKQTGLIQPLIVKKIGEKFEVIAGHRRLLACRMVNVTPVSCIVRADSNIDDVEIKLHENYFRENVNEADEAEFFSFMLTKEKISIDDLSKSIGRSGTYVRERLNLLQGDKTLLEAVRDGVISAGVAKELNMIVDPETRAYYLKYAADGGVTVRTAQEWRKQWEKECRTQEVLEAGVKPKDLPEALPKYYYRCPMCEKSTELGNVRAISVCGECYKTVMAQFAAAPRENVE